MGERRRTLAACVVFATLVTAACSSPDPTTGSTPASLDGDPSTDKLAQIVARGTLILSTDPVYPPQSYAVEGATRASDTECSPDQLTADEITGYDAETGKLVADALGVEPCFVVPTWTEITGGNWGDRWDISFGSGSINEDRMQRLWMTQPYYAVPNYYFVREDSPYRRASDLDGASIGVCASCSHELYLRGELVIPGVEITPTVDDPEIVTFNTEGPGLEKVANGKIDAFLAAEPVGQALIDEGLPLRKIDEVAFTYYPSGFVDKSSGLDVAAFVERVNEIVQQAEAEGSLLALSDEFFGADYVAAAAAYDIDALGQTVT
jgi:polar amino acid transport system substrate-binding protein